LHLPQAFDINSTTVRDKPLDTTEPAFSEPLITNSFGDSYFYGVNHQSFDRIGSTAIYKSRWGEKLFQENHLYIIAGSDSGLLIRHVLKYGIPKGSRYLFVELDSIVPELEFLSGIIEAESNVALCTIDTLDKSLKSFSLDRYAYLDAVDVLVSLAAEEAYLSDYAVLWNSLEKAVQQILWLYKTQFGNCTFFSAQLRNMAENRSPASMLRNVFPGKTAILLGGGPSLDPALPWVKSHRSELVVTAVSRISKRLLEVDLVPDVVFTVDPHPGSFDVGKHMLNFPHKVLLVNAYHSNSRLLGQWGGRSVYLNKNNPWVSFNDNDNVVTAAPTVSNSAVNMLIAMGFKRILLAGLDLCFSPEGYTHAMGSDERKLGALVGASHLSIQTNSGEIAQTDNSFYMAAESLAKQAEYATTQHCRLINCAPHAAKIPNIEYQDLNKIPLEPLGVDVWQTIEQRLCTDNSTSRIEHYEKCLKVLTKAEYKLEKIRRMSKDALTHNKWLFDKKGDPGSFKHKIKMDRIEKELNGALKDYSVLCKIYGMSEFVKTLRPDDKSEWSDDEVEKAGFTYYEAYLTGADNLLKEVCSAVERVQARIEEEKPHPDFELLTSQWEQDQQFHRAALWKQRQSDSYCFTTTINTQIAKFEQQFHSDIRNEKHNYLVNIKQRSNLKGVCSKALDLFRHKNLKGLEHLINGLNTRSESEAKPLLLLTQAYILELNDQPDMAISTLEDLVSDCSDSNPLEYALSRLSVLYLGNMDLEKAAGTLKFLSGISSSYMPQYADMLSIKGDKKSAIDVYTDYLTKIPGDYATMLKLGLLYLDLGVTDGALWIFQHLYDLDPNNSNIARLLNDTKASA